MTFRTSLLERAAQLKKRIVLAEGTDPRVVAAARRMRDEGVAIPIVIGGTGGDVDSINPRKDDRLSAIAELLRDRRPDRVQDGIHALDLAADPVRFAAGLVALGEADGAVAGAVYTTAEVIRAALWAIGPGPGIDLASSAFYMVLPDDRVLTYTDCAVVVAPTPQELAQIALVAATDRRRVVGDAPRVAFLSFSTLGSAATQETERIRQAAAYFRTLAPGILADGELQADAALVPEVARRKAPESPVEGRANILVFPGLDAGNIAYKLTQRLGGATALGPVLQGLALPMSDLSRGASLNDIVEIAAVVALQSGETGS